MPIGTIGSTPEAARLLAYTTKQKPNATKERVLHTAGQHCRVETAVKEFAAHRRRHGKQGAKRKSPAKYVLPDDGELAVYVRRSRPSGRRYWAVATDEGEATHVRREGAVVKENEAVHYIVSLGLDEVNPDDPEQVARAFTGLTTMFRELYPGLQMKLVGQADGDGMTPDQESGEKRGKFHVHGVGNAVVFARMEVDGKVWEPGSKVSGALTDINRVRERQDAWIAERGGEWGLTQRLPPVREQKSEKRSMTDRQKASKGEVSNHDRIREAFWAAMDDPRCVDLDGFKTVMAEAGVEVIEPGWRRGNAPKVPRLSYRVASMATNVMGATLGELYMYDNVVSQLDAIAAGLPRARRPEPPAAGPPKPLTVTTDQELTQARDTVAWMVQEERLDAWLDDWASEENTTVAELLLYRGRVRDRPGDQEVLHRWMGDWEAEKTKNQTQATPTATFEGKGPTKEGQRRPEGNLDTRDSPAAAVAKPGPKLADLVIINDMLAKYGDREASRNDMMSSGMDEETVVAAIGSWQALGRPETAGERELRRRIEQSEQRAQEAPQEASESWDERESTEEIEEHSDGVSRPSEVHGDDEQAEQQKSAVELQEAEQATVEMERKKSRADAGERLRRLPELRDDHGDQTENEDEPELGA